MPNRLIELFKPDYWLSFFSGESFNLGYYRQPFRYICCLVS